MNLRCKAGQMAMIVSAAPFTGIHREVVQRLIGRPVRTVVADADGCWTFEEPHIVEIDLFLGRLTATVFGLADDCLIPIEGDLVDEEVLDEVTA